ncbi:MAG TPA: c-type cytochrome [Mucilaginibacter sp.]
MPRTLSLILLIAAITVAVSMIACEKHDKNVATTKEVKPVKPKWIIPDTSEITDPEEAKLIKYGRSLIINTSYYFGPRGVIAHKSNGLNCQNCHLNAGTKLDGNNFSLTAVGYPRFKERSGSVETIVKKVEDCFERSLSGSRIDSNSREMKAFVTYLTWIGKNVKKGTKPVGSGIEELAFLDRPADTAIGRAVYVSKCRVCHGKNGEGLLNASGTAYTYPPLWGEHSYNIGASIYRLSKFAGFVKHNMPYNADKNAQLTTDQAWDVAAFVNSQPHPYKNMNTDWPKLATKPYDYPFGPYADSQFSKDQRKYGPFGPIKKYYPGLGKR